MRIVINGFGRIGRAVLRQILTSPLHKDIEIVAINDIAPLDTCRYLFQYDSVYGPYPATVTAAKDTLIVGGDVFPFWSQADLRHADLTGVDVVLECTGKATNRHIAQAGIDAGARNVLISGPSDTADKTLVLGANEHDLHDARIVSNASCTTNAIAPFLRMIDHDLGIKSAHITTIHCATDSQPVVDRPGSSLARSRAASVSMIPTTTSAAAQITKVLPDFDHRLTIASVRVPTISVSAIDATLQIENMPENNVTEYLRDTFADCPYIGLTNDACVSIDMTARSESLVIALPETMHVGRHQLRIFGWYDNEWGFAARMIEMARLIAARKIE